ncbi:MAG: hypothetical protein ACREYE_24540 [Gammaproteobacteria bacterium]
MALKFIYGEPEEGTSTLGVVYHMLKERDIKAHYVAMGEEPPKVLGYVINDGLDDEEKED